jgi:hypothetical protein
VGVSTGGDQTNAKVSRSQLCAEALRRRLFLDRCLSGQRIVGAFGHGNSPTEAINKLVDITELTLRAASGSPAFIELQEVPS